MGEAKAGSAKTRSGKKARKKTDSDEDDDDDSDKCSSSDSTPSQAADPNMNIAIAANAAHMTFDGGGISDEEANSWEDEISESDESGYYNEDESA